MISATQIRVGTIIKFEGELYRCTYIMHRTPGNKRGFVQVKMRNMQSHKVIDYRFSSDDKVENPMLDFKEMQYLYSENDQSGFHFMDTSTYDQVMITSDALEGLVPYLRENMFIKVGFYENNPVTIELPETMDFKVITTQPDIKGGTVTTTFKPATLENGIEVTVPPFVKEGDVVRIKTESGEYVERV